jgi:ATP-dependent Clp protease ATP-binding subunit ClpB
MYGQIPSLQKEYDELNQKEKSTIINEVINAEDIAGVVSKWTGIPLEKLSGRENNKLLNIESLLQKRVIGQKDAIEKVSKAIKISKAGLQDPNKPLGSFLFLGPTGVGKTELSKALAEYVFDNEKQMLRLDMSEFMEKHSVSKLIGSPPGYVGYDDGGKLTDSVRRRPYQVILFDEIEKAHPDVFNILLQILDDGRLTDSKGKIVNFKNTLIIMTSNIGSQIPIDDNFDYATKKNLALEELKNHFRLEFLNRIDDIILFNKLNQDNIKDILQNQISIIEKRISVRGIQIGFSEDALKFLSEKGFDPIFGARPLKRLIQDEVLNPLSEVILDVGENIPEKIIFTKDKYGLKIANKDLKVISS